ncbi:dicarboxylate/amino acid:cation symporter [bacterium]|nr:dicarboxylate/amino acid:cation symporter [bacterium]
MKQRSPWWVLAGLFAGMVAGLGLRAWDPGAGPFLQAWIEPWGDLFLRILFLLVIPVLLTALPLGVASAGSLFHLGRTALISLAMTLLLSSLSVVVALGLVNVWKPGKAPAIQAPPPQELNLAGSSGPLAKAVSLIPDDPFGLLAGWFGFSSSAKMMLVLLAVALGWGVVLMVSPRKLSAPLQAGSDRVFGFCTKIIDGLIAWAPGAVFCLTCMSFFRTGPGLLSYLAVFVVAVLLALALQAFGIYPAVLRGLTDYNLKKFWAGVRQPMSTAFATASSNATLPVSIRAAEGALGLRPQVSRFVLTAGASANQNGLALYEGVTVLFLAQSAGVDLNLGQQAIVAGWCIIGSLGTAGVPGGTLPILAAILASLGVDPARTGVGIALILGVDRFLDMCRTCVNVLGDLVIAVVADRWSKGNR